MLNVVAWHEGGLICAGIEESYQPGWYLFTGSEVIPVDVRSPCRDESLTPDMVSTLND